MSTHRTPAEHEAAINAIIAENPAGNDRPTAAIILASRDSAAELAEAVRRGECDENGELTPTTLVSVWDRWHA